MHIINEIGVKLCSSTTCWFHACINKIVRDDLVGYIYCYQTRLPCIMHAMDQYSSRYAQYHLLAFYLALEQPRL